MENHLTGLAQWSSSLHLFFLKLHDNHFQNADSKGVIKKILISILPKQISN